VCDVNTFEGEAAMALESYAQDGIDDEYQVELKRENGYTIVDFSRTVLDIFGDLANKIDRGVIAARFHNTIASVIKTMVCDVSKRQGIADVALSGGTFQNQYLLNRTSQLLEADSLNVHVNQKVPCNDAGISLGQAYIIRERLRKFGVRIAECGI
jgi:hydrogenase maturation protein HypF